MSPQVLALDSAEPVSFYRHHSSLQRSQTGCQLQPLWPYLATAVCVSLCVYV